MGPPISNQLSGLQAETAGGKCLGLELAVDGYQFRMRVWRDWRLSARGFAACGPCQQRTIFSRNSETFLVALRESMTRRACRTMFP